MKKIFAVLSSLILLAACELPTNIAFPEEEDDGKDALGHVDGITVQFCKVSTAWNWMQNNTTLVSDSASPVVFEPKETFANKAGDTLDLAILLAYFIHQFDTNVWISNRWEEGHTVYFVYYNNINMYPNKYGTQTVGFFPTYAEMWSYDTAMEYAKTH